MISNITTPKAGMCDYPPATADAAENYRVDSDERSIGQIVTWYCKNTTVAILKCMTNLTWNATVPSCPAQANENIDNMLIIVWVVGAVLLFSLFILIVLIISSRSKTGCGFRSGSSGGSSIFHISGRGHGGDNPAFTRADEVCGEWSFHRPDRLTELQRLPSYQEAILNNYIITPTRTGGYGCQDQPTFLGTRASQHSSQNRQLQGVGPDSGGQNENWESNSEISQNERTNQSLTRSNSNQTAGTNQSLTRSNSQIIETSHRLVESSSQIPGTTHSLTRSDSNQTAGTNQSLTRSSDSQTAGTNQSFTRSNSNQTAGTNQSFTRSNSNQTAGTNQSFTRSNSNQTAGTNQSFTRSNSNQTAGTNQSFTRSNSNQTAGTNQSFTRSNSNQTARNNQSVMRSNSSQTAVTNQNLRRSSNETAGTNQRRAEANNQRVSTNHGPTASNSQTAGTSQRLPESNHHVTGANHRVTESDSYATPEPDDQTDTLTQEKDTQSCTPRYVDDYPQCFFEEDPPPPYSAVPNNLHVYTSTGHSREYTREPWQASRRRSIDAGPYPQQNHGDSDLHLHSHLKQNANRRLPCTGSPASRARPPVHGHPPQHSDDLAEMYPSQNDTGYDTRINMDTSQSSFSNSVHQSNAASASHQSHGGRSYTPRYSIYNVNHIDVSNPAFSCNAIETTSSDSSAYNNNIYTSERNAIFSENKRKPTYHRSNVHEPEGCERLYVVRSSKATSTLPLNVPHALPINPSSHPHYTETQPLGTSTPINQSPEVARRFVPPNYPSPLPIPRSQSLENRHHYQEQLTFYSVMAQLDTNQGLPVSQDQAAVPDNIFNARSDPARISHGSAPLARFDAEYTYL